MEYIGVPLFVLVRALGPPTVVLAVGALLILRRRPPRAGLLWSALATHILAAALPFLWLLVQVSTGHTGETFIAFVMTLAQPGVEFVAWLLVLAAVVARPSERSGTEPGNSPVSAA